MNSSLERIMLQCFLMQVHESTLNVTVHITVNVRLSSVTFCCLPVVFHLVSNDSPSGRVLKSGIATSLNSSQPFSELASSPSKSLANTISSCWICLTAPLFTRIRESHRSDERCKLIPRQIKIWSKTPLQPCIIYSGVKEAPMNGNIHKGLGGSHQIPFFVLGLYHSSILSTSFIFW